MKKNKRTKGQSKGEAAVERVLKEFGLEFTAEKTSDLRSWKGGLLRYDFAVVINEEEQDYLLIEYDGKQHTKPVGWSSRVTITKLNSCMNRLTETIGLKLRQSLWILSVKNVLQRLQ